MLSDEYDHEVEHSPSRTIPVRPPPGAEHLYNATRQYVVYTGHSMNPTLCEPDIMEIAEYGDRPVQRGDVAYFMPPGRDEHENAIVHRVVHVTPAGIRTRGDNNRQDDNYLLQPAHIIGQVVIARRGKRQRQIVGGWRGHLIGYALRLRRCLIRANAKWLSRGYRVLVNTGFFRRLVPEQHRPRVVCFHIDELLTYKVLMGERIVGYYDGRIRRWRIKRPFLLFVDSSRLPQIRSADNNQTSA